MIGAKMQRARVLTRVERRKKGKVMAINLSKKNGSKTLEVQVSGKLVNEENQQLVPEFERLVKQNGKLRALLDLTDFHGWEAGALWDNINFDLRHLLNLKRFAMAGNRKWEKAMSAFCEPFTTAKIRYFEHAAIADARAWLEQG